MKLKILCASLLFIVTSCFAQSWPQKPVRILVPVSPGSGTDVLARIIFEQVQKQTGKPMLIENKVGASGTVAANITSKSEPDGHILLVNTVTHVVVATSYKNLPYSVDEDFTNISGLIAQPFVVTTSSRWKSIEEIVKYGRENPGKLNYGTPGIGSSGHLFMEKFSHAAKIKMENIPFRGTPEAVTEMMAMRLDMFPAPVSSVVSLSKDGRINAVAVSTNRRSPALPDVPTMAEAGVPGADYFFWIGLYGPAKMDPALTSKIYSEVQKAMATPEVKAKLIELGAEPIKLTPNEFSSFVRKEIKHNGDIITRSKITMD
jgi:tripartite-type tricarboxylate transporter receptor subunit TctC